MNDLIARHRSAICALCHEYGVARLEVFGSVMTDALDPNLSDIDFLVEYPPDYDFGPWLKRFHELQRGLPEILIHPVDLVTTKALNDP